MSKNCKDKEKGIKFIGCYKFGHISKECPIKIEKANDRQLVVENIMKMGLFDTGSKFNVVTERVYNSLN